MGYELAPEHELLRRNTRRLAEEVVGPRAAEIDRTGEFPWDVVEAFRAQGLLGAVVPEEYGGGGIDMVSTCIVIEEIARVDATCSLIVAGQELGMQPLTLAGSEAQKQRYLGPVGEGRWLLAFALSEPEAGSDVAGLRTRAVRRGDRYVLNGQKLFITNGGVADLYTVFASTAPELGSKGLSMFLVEKDTPGFKVGRKLGKMGIRGSQTAELFFEDCELPVECRVGEEGEGFKVAMMTLDRTRPTVGAQALGIAQGAFDYAAEYIQQRRQFGQPLAEFQGVQFMLADMATKIEAARHLIYKTAFTIDGYGPVRLPVEVSRLSAMAKLFSSDVAMQVTTDAVQLLGGYGYISEHPVERMMRDAKITQIYEGTNQIQRLVIARSFLS